MRLLFSIPTPSINLLSARTKLIQLSKPARKQRPSLRALTNHGLVRDQFKLIFGSNQRHQVLQGKL
jgi:hypothetical protein